MNLAAVLDPSVDSDARVTIAARDHDELASEFGAIMHASGFGDRVVATTLTPRPAPASAGGRASLRHHHGRLVDLDGHGPARVRSPPVVPRGG